MKKTICIEIYLNTLRVGIDKLNRIIDENRHLGINDGYVWSEQDSGEMYLYLYGEYECNEREINLVNEYRAIFKRREISQLLLDDRRLHLKECRDIDNLGVKQDIGYYEQEIESLDKSLELIESQLYGYSVCDDGLIKDYGTNYNYKID